MNARGILPATYQLLHLLSYPGGEGTPSLAGGTPSLARGYPSLDQGIPSILTWLVGTPLWGYSQPGLEYPSARTGVTSQEGTWNQSLGYPQKGHGTSGSIMGWRWGIPLERTWAQWKYYGMEMGYPRPCEWTDTCENITFPHPVGNAGGNYLRNHDKCVYEWSE